MNAATLMLASLFGGAALPASATEWINCTDVGSNAGPRLNFLVGDVGVLSVAGLTISAGGKNWASDPIYGPGASVQVGQAYEDAESIRIDALDAGFAVRVAELRLFKASEGGAADVYAGTLRVPGVGAWAVSCDGP